MLSRLFIIGARLCHYPFSNTFAEGVRLNCAAPIEFGVQLELELIVLKFNLHGLRLFNRMCSVNRSHFVRDISGVRLRQIGENHDGQLVVNISPDK
jgi:hypothetical protein